MMKDEHRCFCELAPLYALDLLDLEERLWVEAQIVDCPDLAEELASYQTAVSLMPFSAEPVPMAADLKDRLFDRIDSQQIEQLDSAPALAVVIPPPEFPPPEPPLHQMFALRSQELKWQPHRIEGVNVVVLFVDRVQRMRSMIVKVAAGVTYPLHRHGGVEEIYMLEGELIIDEQVYLAGDYIRSQSGSLHAPSTNMSCMFLIRASMDDEYF